MPIPRPLGSYLNRTFAALRYRNYRLWFIGQMVSLFGTWMQSTAQGYLVFQLTRSAAYLGYVGFAAGVPVWLFTLFGGVAADRLPRRTLLIATQLYMMLLAFVLAALVFGGWVRPWHVVLLAFLLGTGNAFDAPARQSFVLEMVEREDLANAIALNSAMFNTATAVGPALGGLAYAAFGPGWCFGLNGISFLAVIAALALMRIRPHESRPVETSAVRQMRAGLGYIGQHSRIRVLIGIVALTSLFGMSFTTLIPAWAVRVLHGDAVTNGWLQSARGLGALAGALAIASLGRFRHKGFLLTLGAFALPLMVLGFAFVRSLPTSLALLVGAGGSLILIYNLANALVQSLSQDELRGRVMSVYTLSLLGLLPVGALLSGALAQRIGEPLTVILGAGVSLGAAILVQLAFPAIRHLE